MSEETVSDQVKQFILNHISSVAQLEILLLLHIDPRRSWSPSAVARELRIEAAGAQEQLQGLAASGLVAIDPAAPDSYRFAPQTPELEAGSVALAQAYLIRRVTIMSLIFSKPSDKIRVFSDAFRLRKDTPNG